MQINSTAGLDQIIEDYAEIAEDNVIEGIIEASSTIAHTGREEFGYGDALDQLTNLARRTDDPRLTHDLRRAVAALDN